MLESSERYDDALAEYDQAAAVADPGDARPFVAHSRLSLALGAPLTRLAEGVRRLPSHPVLGYLQAQAALREGDLELAATLFRAAPLGDADSRLGLAEALLGLGRPDSADQTLDDVEAILRTPSSSSILEQPSKLRTDDKDKNVFEVEEEMEEQEDEEEAVLPHSGGPVDRMLVFPRLLLLRGQVRALVGSDPKAIVPVLGRALDAALAIDAASPLLFRAQRTLLVSVYSALAAAHQAAGDATLAEAATRSAMLLQPDDVVLRAQLAASLLAQGKASDALETCDAVALPSNDTGSGRFDRGMVLLIRGQACAALGRVDEARQDLENFLRCTNQASYTLEESEQRMNVNKILHQLK